MLNTFNELKKELSLDTSTNTLTVTIGVPKKTRRTSLIVVKGKTVKNWVENSGYVVVDTIKSNRIDNSESVADNTWVYEVEKLIQATQPTKNEKEDPQPAARPENQEKEEKAIDNSEAEAIIETKTVQKRPKTRKKGTKTVRSTRKED